MHNLFPYSDLKKKKKKKKVNKVQVFWVFQQGDYTKSIAKT